MVIVLLLTETNIHVLVQVVVLGTPYHVLYLMVTNHLVNERVVVAGLTLIVLVHIILEPVLERTKADIHVLVITI